MRSTAVVLAFAFLMYTAVCAQGLADLPARVIDSSPKPFATGVPTTLNQVSVTFDRPMNIESRGGLGSVRFCGVGLVGRETQPAWDATGTILSIPVSLEPDVTYSLAINESKNRGLVDANGVPAVGYFMVFSTGARTTEEFPPYVVKTDPENGARDVDYRLKTMTVTFSRPVAPNDCSWVIYQGSGEYPAPRDAGMPQLSGDRLTATLQIRLSPDTVYAVGVNDPAYFGYKDVRGWPVLPYGACFKTAK